MFRIEKTEKIIEFVIKYCVNVKFSKHAFIIKFLNLKGCLLRLDLNDDTNEWVNIGKLVALYKIVEQCDTLYIIN